MKKLERKDFLKMVGGAVVGTGTGYVFSGAPFQSLQWLVEWTQDQYTPQEGEEKYIQSICNACPDKCTISVRKIGERAVKVETSNQGCPMGQSLVHVLYHPERIKTPLKQVGKKGSGKFEPVSWDDAVNTIAKKIDSLRKDGKAAGIVGINESHAGISGMLLDRLITAAGSPNMYEDPCFCSLSKAAVELTQNTEGSIYYDFDKADFILSFGARLLEGWGNAGAMHRLFAGWKDRGVRFVHIDTICTRTASAADQWVAIKPGTEAALALGIANILITKFGKRSAGAQFGRFHELIINEYTPAKVSELTGIKPEALEQLAKEFASARRPVAVTGKGGQGVSSSTMEMAAVQALNSLAGSLGSVVKVKTEKGLGSMQLDSYAKKGLNSASKAKGLDEFIAGDAKADLIIINGANPVFLSTYGKKLIEKMKEASTVVVIAPLLNDTAMYADYVLPSLSSLEMKTEAGGPVVSPRFKAIHAGDSLIRIARKIDGVKQSFPWKNYTALISDTSSQVIKSVSSFSFPAKMMSKELEETQKTNAATSDYPLAMLPYEITMVGDGRGLALPYVLKGLNNTVLTEETLWVLMNPSTADEYGVSEGEKVDLESSRGELDNVRVHLTKTIAPGVIAIPLGFGHTAYTKYATDKGVNPKEIMNNKIDPVSGTADWWLTRVKIS
ncbi:MAG: molybdopterin-containing oxidoreductase family protein [Spirochaetota bacterium]